jgi:hypothetical protein
LKKLLRSHKPKVRIPQNPTAKINLSTYSVPDYGALFLFNQTIQPIDFGFNDIPDGGYIGA